MGVNRNDPPGLRTTPLDTSRCRQLVGHTVQSTAVHSQSQGWLPMVKLDLEHVPLVGRTPAEPSEVLELIISPADLYTLRLRIEEAMARATEDARVGVVDSLPEPRRRGR